MEGVRSQIDEIESNIVTALCGHSFFSSKIFMNLWKTLGGRPLYWSVKEDDAIVGLYPGVEFGTGGLKRFQSMPDGLYGRLFLDGTVDFNEAARMLTDSIGAYGYTKIFLYDYYNQFSQLPDYTVESCSTILVDISDKNWQPPDKKMQSEIRKAERENVRVDLFQKEKHFDKFLALMKQTEKRHNRQQKYPDIFFEKLADIAEEDKRVLWYWSESENVPVSSHINFIEDEMVVNWQVYFDKNYSHLKVNQKIIYDMAKKLQDCNLRILNLGGSPDTAESLVDYKLKYGGKKYSYHALVKKSLLGKII